MCSMSDYIEAFLFRPIFMLAYFYVGIFSGWPAFHITLFSCMFMFLHIGLFHVGLFSGIPIFI